MAIAVASSANNSATSTSLVITKPSGLAEGDLLVAQLSYASDNATTIATPAGWTSAGNHDVTGTGSAKTVFKEADAGDVAASNFTFTGTGSAQLFGGALHRVTGPQFTSPADPSATGDSTTNASTYSFTVSATPTLDDTLVLVNFCATGSSTTTISSYATTPTITFTESYDYTQANIPDRLNTGGAYGVMATAAEITAFGTTFASTRDDAMGLLTTIKPAVDASGGNTLEVATPFFPTQSGMADTQGDSVFFGTDTALFNASGNVEHPTNWTNESEVSTTWTNEDKL